jgi:hypothetical protein
MTAIDPLSLIRQATMTGAAVNYVDSHYIFGSHKFHESVKTCFKRTLKSKKILLHFNSIFHKVNNHDE